MTKWRIDFCCPECGSKRGIVESHLVPVNYPILSVDLADDVVPEEAIWKGLDADYGKMELVDGPGELIGYYCSACGKQIASDYLPELLEWLLKNRMLVPVEMKEEYNGSSISLRDS